MCKLCVHLTKLNIVNIFQPFFIWYCLKVGLEGVCSPGDSDKIKVSDCLELSNFFIIFLILYVELVFGDFKQLPLTFPSLFQNH